MAQPTIREVLQGIPQAARTVKSLVGNSVKPIYDDYAQLWGKGTNLRNDAELLKGKIGKHIPPNEAFRNPQAMQEWSLAAALNAPMGLVLSNNIKGVLSDLAKKNPSTQPKIPTRSIFGSIDNIPDDIRIKSDNYFSNKDILQDYIDIDNLIPTQKNLTLDNIKSINGIEEPIKTIFFNDKNYIIDGHHRAALAKILGSKNIKAYTYDPSLDNILNKK